MTVRRINPAIIMLVTDIFIALTIMLILTAISILIYSEYRKMAIVSAGPIEAASNLKTDISTYYALYGEWPEDKGALLELFPEKENYYEDMEFADKGYRSQRSHTIVRGAIDVSINKLQGNNIVTLRPAVPAEDPLGPVKWVAGGQVQAEGWTIIGEDHTTVEERYIRKELK